MALNKELKTPRGIKAKYWRIDGRTPSVNERTKEATVALYGFVDKDSTDVEPIDTRVITITGDNFIEVEDRTASKDSRDWLYIAIKAMKDEEGNDGEFASALKV